MNLGHENRPSLTINLWQENRPSLAYDLGHKRNITYSNNLNTRVPARNHKPTHLHKQYTYEIHRNYLDDYPHT